MKLTDVQFGSVLVCGLIILALTLGAIALMAAPGDGPMIEPYQIIYNTCSDKASATTVTANECDIVNITGSTTITTINTCLDGRRLTLVCPAAATWKISSGVGNVVLWGGIEFQCGGEGVLNLRCDDGLKWYEESRSRTPVIDFQNRLLHVGTFIATSNQDLSTFTGEPYAALQYQLWAGGEAGLGILTDTATGIGSLYFCDSADTTGTDCTGILRYLHSSDVLETYVGGGTGSLVSDYIQAELVLNVKDSRIGLNDDATCAFHTSDAWFGDRDCDSTLDSNEYSFESRGGGFGGARSTLTASGYLNYHGLAMSSTMGYVPSKSGSIVGVGMAFDSVVHVTTGNVTVEVHKNGSSVFSAVGSAASGVTYIQGSQADGVDTFVAGDRLGIFVTFGPATAYDGTANAMAQVELLYDPL